METILRKRHPNSLPMLMWAASNASDADEKKAPSVVYLEKRILKLEKELEEKDDEAKKGLRLMEQKYNVMKVGFIYILPKICCC
jgi:protein QN1